jgi:arylformamidase
MPGNESNGDVDTFPGLRYNGVAMTQRTGISRDVTRPLQIFDATVPISELMPVWPGDPRIKIEPVSSIARGDAYNASQLSLSSHTGTHVDAPYHFIQRGLTVDKLPLELLIGPALVAEVDGLEGNTIQVFDLARLQFPRDITRLLLKTSNSYFWEDRLSEFEYNFVHLGPKTAEWIVKRGIKLIGVDYLSIEALGAREHEVHRTLLEAGVVIVEGLNLSRVPAGRCQVMCLPLRIEGCDGAPARVLVIRD